MEGRPFKAIAALSLNRVIGSVNRLPWHLPEDFKWFKRMTTGQVIVLGRKTFESIGKVLSNRTTLVLTRSNEEIQGVRTIHRLEEIDSQASDIAGRQIFICGGAQVYELALPWCSALYLTWVKKEVEGDARFPAFEHLFVAREVLQENPEFRIVRYDRKPS